MKKRAIAINPDKGIFLGSVAGYAVFSKTDPIGISKAYGFDTPDDARDFFERALPSFANTMFYPVIETNDDYVSCVDIIKQGYEMYTHNMIDYLDMPSSSIH